MGSNPEQTLVCLFYCTLSLLNQGWELKKYWYQIDWIFPPLIDSCGRVGQHGCCCVNSVKHAFLMADGVMCQHLSQHVAGISRGGKLHIMLSDHILPGLGLMYSSLFTARACLQSLMFTTYIHTGGLGYDLDAVPCAPTNIHRQGCWR